VENYSLCTAAALAYNRLMDKILVPRRSKWYNILITSFTSSGHAANRWRSVPTRTFLPDTSICWLLRRIKEKWFLLQERTLPLRSDQFC